MNKDFRVIIAGSYREFVFWCDQNGMSPKDHRNIMYVSEPEQLCGLQFKREQVIRTGTYFMRDDINEIEHELITRYC